MAQIIQEALQTPVYGFGADAARRTRQKPPNDFQFRITRCGARGRYPYLPDGSDAD